MTATTQTLDDKQEEELPITEIPDINNKDELYKAIKKEWHRNLYRVTQLEMGDPYECGMNDTRIYIINPKKENPQLKNLKKKNSVVGNILEGGPVNEGEIIGITDRLSVDRLSVDGDPEAKRDIVKFTLLIGVGDKEYNKDDLGGVEKLWDSMKNMSRILEKEQINAINIGMVSNINVWTLRKLIEIALQGRAVTIKITLPPEKFEVAERNGEAGWEISAGRKTKWKRTLEIKPNKNEGTSYATVLGEIRRNIKPEELGIEINRIRKTKAGNLRLEVTERRQGAVYDLEKLTENTLKEKAEKTQVVERRKQAIVISDIDMVTTKEEVVEAVMSACDGATMGDVVVHTLKEKPDRGTQVAVVDVESRYAKLLVKNRIKIGWIKCPVRELIDPIRCYKCSGYGHTARLCEKERVDWSGKCRNCWQEGHLLRECPNQARCLHCNCAGHRTGTMACEVYRKAVKDARADVDKEIQRRLPAPPDAGKAEGRKMERQQESKSVSQS